MGVGVRGESGGRVPRGGTMTVAEGVRSSRMERQRGGETWMGVLCGGKIEMAWKIGEKKAHAATRWQRTEARGRNKDNGKGTAMNDVEMAAG